ncbi:hypothetical protein Q0590_26380 [Rhodocytophaga aerolata]|uniref:Uncharacterized protein n=1 Tax=Rhodocytophaga aerolata TaxID=455078 RepID=A0ABT8RCK9_9BACT|nr:hypothetical protein [Rhodocytophaga aerolata]MDO1449834.1 hypothetical protein [Rhodocytophaga aerolata]
MPIRSLFLQATTGALQNFSGFVILAINIIFIIVLAIGLINTVRKFITNDPGAMGSLGQLIVGVIVFLAFTIFKEDLQGIFGTFAG